MKAWWVGLAVGLAALAVAPALIAGGGIIIAAVLAVAILVALLGGPKAWELYETQHMGSRGNSDVREWLEANGRREGGDER